MRRAAVVLGIIAILASSCGGDSMAPRLATTLENRVAAIRDLAETGQAGRAVAATRNLIELVTARMESGRLDQGKGIEILAAADGVVQRLALLPRPSPTESTSPPPPPEEHEGKGKDRGEGHGHDEDGKNGHGND